MKGGVFVIGTDTGVGKTLVSCALLHAYAARGDRVVGMKPVASGCIAGPGGLLCDDVAALRAASNVEAPHPWINPYSFAPPIAPHIAAEEIGEVIRTGRIREAFQNLAAVADRVVVEGVGGFRVPLNDLEDGADLACVLALPLVLVVGMRLGCLNHALLTVEAVAARGLRLVGWVANRIDPGMARFDGNLATLRARLDIPCLGVVEHLSNPDVRLVAQNLLLPGGAG